MPIDFNINRATNIITHKWEGVIIGKYMFKRLEELTQLTSWTFGMSHIIDIREANFEQIAQAELLQILTRMSANTLRNAKGKIIGEIAFLTNKEKINASYEIKLFNLFSTKTKRKMGLFYDIVSLHKWLRNEGACL